MQAQGFLVGGFKGALTVVDRDSESKPYRLGRAFQVGGQLAAKAGAEAQLPPAGRVRSLAASCIEDGIACLTEDNQLAILTVPTTDRKARGCGGVRQPAMQPQFFTRRGASPQTGGSLPADCRGGRRRCGTWAPHTTPARCWAWPPASSARSWPPAAPTRPSASGTTWTAP